MLSMDDRLVMCASDPSVKLSVLCQSVTRSLDLFEALSVSHPSVVDVGWMLRGPVV